MECLKNDDRVRANQRQRVCVSAMRITCCIMLCGVAEKLLKQHGGVGAVEEVLSHDSTLTEKMLKRLQTEKYLQLFDLVADELLENNLYFFRAKIEAATTVLTNTTRKAGKNDSVYARLSKNFTIDDAFSAALSVKGSSITQNSVTQMLKNWKKQGLILPGRPGMREYVKF